MPCQYIKLNQDELNILCLCAFRYALTRSTGLSHEISNLLIKLKDNLHPWAQEQVMRDIDREISRMNDYDTDNWNKVIKEFSSD